MNWFWAKFGSNATPSRPRSPLESTFSATNGVSSSVPSLTTRSSPACSATNSRPSGANSIAVGSSSPAANTDSAKPVGRTTGASRRSSESNDIAGDGRRRRREAVGHGKPRRNLAAIRVPWPGSPRRRRWAAGFDGHRLSWSWPVATGFPPRALDHDTPLRRPFRERFRVVACWCVGRAAGRDR